LGGYVALPQFVGASTIEGQPQATHLPEISYPRKLLVFSAGAAFNILFAFALSSVVWIVGEPRPADFAVPMIGYVSPTIRLPDGSVVPGPAAQAGLRAGDIVRKVDSHSIHDWPDLVESIVTSSGRDTRNRPLTVFTIERAGHLMTATLHPRVVGSDRFRRVGILSAFNLAIASVDHGSAEDLAGFRPGDKILKLDDTPILSDAAYGEYLATRPHTTVHAHLLRGTSEITLPITPGHAIGGFSLQPSPSVIDHPSPFTQVRDQSFSIFRALESLVTPGSDIALSKMSGPIGVVRMLHQAATSGIIAVLAFTSFLNLNLAFLNLLPIPLLDGGHILFATAARLRGRALPAKFILTSQGVFLVLLLSMILFSSVSDVTRWFRDSTPDPQSWVR
jgi:regulator of sigma E protease